MASLIFGLFGGFLAWIATTIVGQPLYTFLSLRTDAARLVSFYERPLKTVNLDRLLTSGGDDAWMIERRRAYQTCGTQFFALAASNGTLSSILHKCRYYPESAGQALLTLGDIEPESEAANQTQKTLISALKLNLAPQ